MAPSVVQLRIHDHIFFTKPLNILFVPAEGLPHRVPGTGAGQPQSGAGYQEQTAPPAGEEADGDRQTGEARST